MVHRITPGLDAIASMRYHSRGLQANGTMDQDELDDVRAPAIWFRRRAGGQSLSKLGGLPTLPSGIAWPRQHETGTPLHFLTQIDLSQLPRTPLESAPHAPVFPRSGICFSLPTWLRRCCGTRTADRLRQRVLYSVMALELNVSHRATCRKSYMLLVSWPADITQESEYFRMPRWNHL